jgi:hypothetical protein
VPSNNDARKKYAEAGGGNGRGHVVLSTDDEGSELSIISVGRI